MAANSDVRGAGSWSLMQARVGRSGGLKPNGGWILAATGVCSAAMKALFAALALIAPLLVTAPAQADITYSGCANPTYKKTVKFKKAFRYSVEQPAIACAEHFDGGASCQMLSSYDSMASKVTIEVGKDTRSARAWDDAYPVMQPIMTGCTQVTTGATSPYVTVNYKGWFIVEIKRKSYIARPGLQVRFNGMTTGDGIVSFKRTGHWDFKRLKQ